MPERTAILISPEKIWPPHGGGPLRTLSILEYLRQRYVVDLVLFHDPAQGDPRTGIPAAAVRDVLVIPLPLHARTSWARALRNLRRLARGAVPLTDRFAGFDAQLETWLSGRSYDLALVEHFWCAPYAALLRPAARRLVLDLHNIESNLLETSAAAASGLPSLALRRFAACCRRQEERWLPCFDLLLAASRTDAQRLPSASTVAIVPNTLPLIDLPPSAADGSIVFSGNLAYGPNCDAVSWFAAEIWPLLRRRLPHLKWRLVGRGHEAVASHIAGDSSIECTGPVDDAIAVIARSSVAIAPLRAGSGTRIKILEAWAAGVPVVSTSLGCEGLECTPDLHLLIADQPASFADAIVRILASPSLAEQLRCSARTRFDSHYNWSAAWRALSEAGI
jgi:polysaccharide biosynthesis protein PslH